MHRYICTHRYRCRFSYFPFFFILWVAYYRYSFAICFSHLTMYPGNHSSSVLLHIEIFLIHVYSCLVLHYVNGPYVVNSTNTFLYMSSYFQYFKIRNNAAINIFVQMYFWYFQHRFLEMGFLGQNVNTYDFFLGIVKFLSIKFVPMDIPTSNVRGIPVCS